MGDAEEATPWLGGGLTPRVHDSVEFIEVDPEKQMDSVECTICDWNTGNDWHTDGGMRGYKIWSLLKRAPHFQRTTADGRSMRWEATQIDPDAGSPEDHASILVAPADNLRTLCDLAVELNSTMRERGEHGAEFMPPSAEAADVRTGPSSSAQGGESIFDYGASQAPLDVVSRQRDVRALEAAGCVVRAQPGDAVVLFPDLFHRTQDLVVWRLALLVEAL